MKNLPAMQETQVRSLGWEDHLEKGKASHSSILAWRIPWDSPGKNTGVGCYALLQGIFPGIEPAFPASLELPEDSLLLSHQGSPTAAVGDVCVC